MGKVFIGVRVADEAGEKSSICRVGCSDELVRNSVPSQEAVWETWRMIQCFDTEAGRTEMLGRLKSGHIQEVSMAKSRCTQDGIGEVGTAKGRVAEHGGAKVSHAEVCAFEIGFRQGNR